MNGRRLLPAILPLLLWAAPAGAQGSGAPEEPGFIQFTVNRSRYVPFMEAVLDEQEQPYLEANALLSALEIPARFDPGLNSIVGALADGRTTFTVNFDRKTVEVGDRKLSIGPGMLRRSGGKIYILWSEAVRWLPVQMTWSIAAYEIAAVTDYPLPSVEKTQREQLRQRLMSQRSEGEETTVPRPVPWFDPGMFQVGASARATSEADPRGSLTLRGVQRFLKGDLEYGLTLPVPEDEANQADLDYFRLTYRTPSRSSEAVLGDTYSTFTPLLLPLASFQGVSFIHGERRLRYGRTVLIGTAPPGSEVDLYRFGVLIDFTTVAPQGLYRFENIPLTLAATIFEVRIYTPDGRRLTEFQQVTSSEEMLPAGALAAQGGVGTSQVESNPFAVTGGEVRYGLFSSLTLGSYVLQLSKYRVFNDPEPLATDSQGLFLLWRPVGLLLLLGERATDALAEGAATRLGATLAFDGLSLELDQRQYEGDFAPPARARATEFSEPALALSATELSARTRLLATNTSWISTLVDFGAGRAFTSHEVRLDRRLLRDLTGNLSLRRERFSEGGEEVGGQDQIQVFSSYALDRLARIELSLTESEPVASPTSTFATLAYQKTSQFYSPWGYRLSYSQASNTDDQAAASASYLFANNLRLDGQVDSLDNWNLSLSYSVPFRYGEEGLETFAPNMFPRAGVEGRVFVDRNDDGERQDDEEPLPGVKVLMPGVDGLVSDDQGRFRGWGLHVATPVDIGFDVLTVDALYLSKRRRTRIFARPGELVILDIPLVAAGGMEGRVGAVTQTTISPAYGLELVLERNDGEVRVTTGVEWDGTFILEGVPPGTYSLAASAEQPIVLGLGLRPESRKIIFEAGAEPTWLEGIIFESVPVPVPKPAPPQPPAPEAAGPASSQGK